MESPALHITGRLAAFIEASSRVIVSGVKQTPTEKYLTYLIQLRFRRSS
jgi:hypothetical protein